MVILIDIIKEKNTEILNLLLSYLKDLNGIEETSYEISILKIVIENISTLMQKILKNSHENNDFSEMYKKEFVYIGNKCVACLLTEHDLEVNLRKLLSVVKCYRRAYIKALLDEELYEYDSLNVPQFRFIVNFFDEVECTCGEIWNETSESEMKFKALTELDSVFVFMYDGDECVYLNPSAEKFTGYERREVKEMRFRDIFHTDYQKFIIESKENLHSTHNNACTYELKLITKWGEEKWIEFSRGIIKFRDKSIMIGIAFDINNKKMAEENLKNSENRYRKLVELMPDAVLVHHNREITYCNKAFAKLVGYESPEEIINKNIYDLVEIHADYKASYQQRIDRVLRNGSVSLTEEKFIRKQDGKVVEIEATSTLVPYKDTVAILEILRNISERKRIEELKQKIKEKTILLKQTMQYDKIRNEFFANISHELKTPINVIFAAIQVIELYETKDDDSINKNKINKYLFIMKQNCYRLIRIVNNLIDTTKIDAGYYEINLNNFNIVSIVEDITISVAAYIEKHGMNLTFDTDIEEKIIACDPDKIERIMLNLLSNAVKFTKPGGEIFVNIRDGVESITISVRDTGIGIPKEKQEEVFKRFIQVDKSLSRDREGSGIGLSLVKSLVQLHKGKISLKSELGSGTEFIIELPVGSIDDEKECNINNIDNVYNNIERIHIEFSDIYNNNN